MSMTKPYRTRVTCLLVIPEGEPSFSEMATTVEIEDEGAGEFVVVAQRARVDMGQIAINPEEWPELRAAIDRLVGQCEGVRDV